MRQVVLVALILSALGVRPGAAQRPDTDPSLLFAFEPDASVERYDTERVRVHFTREGMDAVLPIDENADLVPDFVVQTADAYDEALVHYERLGFRAPPNDGALGGDGRLDVYLLDFFGSADGSFQRDACDALPCSGYMVQENDFTGYGYSNLVRATRIVGSHELFHGVQAAYRTAQNIVFSEGTATWATESFDGTLDDFERATFGFLSSPERPLFSATSDVLDRFAYGSAIFFRHLEEAFGEDLVVDLLEATDEAVWNDALPAVLEDAGSDFGETFLEFVRWNMGAGHADPSGYGNGRRYARLSARDAVLPLVDERPRHFRASARVYRAALAGRSTFRIALNDPGDTLRLLALAERGGAPDFDLEARGVRSLELNTSDADGVLFAVVNTASEGQSDRASVCAGSPAEVDACLAGFGEPDAGVNDAGAVDGGAQADGGVDASFSDGSVQADATPSTSRSGGCQAGGAAPCWLLALGLLLARTRRR